ncbi:MAG: RDD family protein [Candidatus Adiutrix sp.]|jgi:uncharacterized RDD family membrane protein YckC|nr:RDD family protein [Candidatus Adiutrix sp.]
MALSADRVGALLEGVQRRRRVLLSPEGVPLEIQVAGHGERLGALALDLVFMLGAVVILFLLLIFYLFAGVGGSVGRTLFLFLAFVIRVLYFAHFELAWQGRTPGKKICGLRVINRQGGDLTPSAVIARNLTREVEVFLPLTLFLSLGAGENGWQDWALFGWLLMIASLPLWNRDHLRAGDLIGGTQVIAMPRRVLLADLSREEAGRFTFTPEQLALYGAFELQVLEEFLRRPPGPETDRLLDEVSRKIRRKIGWSGPVETREARRFLTEFYSAERADLERGQLFGKFRADKKEAADRRPGKKN